MNRFRWALVALLVSPACLLAQTTTPEPDGGSLAPVRVIGSGSADQRWRSSVTADVVFGSELRDGQLQINLSEGLARVPGLVIRNRENYAQDLQVSIRGFGARSTFGVRGLRLFVDGIPASAPDGSGQAANFPLGSADRIEVVRGPFASLYGASSGGAILLYTEDGRQPGEWRTGLALGANGLWRLSTQIKGQTGSAEAPGWSYTLDAGKFATDGARPQSAADRSTLNAKLSRPHEGGRTTLVFNRQTAFALDPQGLTQAQLDADPEQTGPQALLYNTRKSVSQTQAGLAWEQALGGGHKLELMGYGGQRRVIQFLSVPPGAQSAASSAGGVIDLDRDYWGFNARWRLQTDWRGGQLDLSAGLAGDRQSDLRRGYENFVGSTVGVQGALRRDETNRATTLDPYLRASWQKQEWTLEGGLRRVNARYRSNDAFLSNGDQSGATEFSGYLPVVGARWQLSPQLQAHAAIGRGLETPTLNEAAYRSTAVPASTPSSMPRAAPAPKSVFEGATQTACGARRCSTSAPATRSSQPVRSTDAPSSPTAAPPVARGWNSRRRLVWATSPSPAPTPTCARATAAAPPTSRPATACPASPSSNCSRSWAGHQTGLRASAVCSRWRRRHTGNVFADDANTAQADATHAARNLRTL